MPTDTEPPPSEGVRCVQGVTVHRDDIDPHDLRPGDITTAAEFARQAGRCRTVVNHWRDNGYINQAGKRVYVRPIAGEGTRRPIYLTADLEAAELATRLRSVESSNPAIAGWQRMKRAERKAAA
ncbi:hypothetical protein ACFRCG_39835 [Embleya sp. NPDC056575]|uniref:hypothetical protein n=1 Tax=unclassified Embleya TaxID=2699296 RepID=UPI0036840459